MNQQTVVTLQAAALELKRASHIAEATDREMNAEVFRNAAENCDREVARLRSTAEVTVLENGEEKVLSVVGTKLNDWSIDDLPESTDYTDLGVCLFFILLGSGAFILLVAGSYAALQLVTK